VTLGPSRVPVDLIVVRIDPARVRLTLEIARDGSAVRPWTLADVPADAEVAFNAGQFTDDGPWGWVVHRGREFQPPGSGALAAAISVDSTGRVRIVGADSVGTARDARTSLEALQSYPLLLLDGAVPNALCAPGAVDAAHRDIRMVLGTTATGDVLVVLSRYRGGRITSRMTERLPVGPTTFESVELMRRLGAVSAVMLDGGLSAQLLVRVNGRAERWAGLRGVPLAVVGRRRTREN
jgi:exopolysaccharide biosynthesis protein